MPLKNPYLDDTAQALRFWATKYKTRFNEDPAVFSAYGYLVIDAFIKVAQKAGPNLTTDSFIKVMDTMTFPREIFGSPPGTFTPPKRLGRDAPALAQTTDGKWPVVAAYSTV